VPRYPASSTISYSIGPGAVTPAVKLILVTTIVVFVVQQIVPEIDMWLGLSAALVIEEWWVWQLVTYMFLHADVFHILFNLLTVWMIGVELERLWGTVAFLRYYFVTGVGAALTTLLVALLPFDAVASIWRSLIVGASGAVYGLLFAYAYYYPTRPMLFFPIPIPIQAKYFVLILGAIAFFASLGGRASGVAHATHLGGLLAGYLYLTRGRGGLWGEIKYRWLKWKMARMRRRFDVVQGGRRGKWDQHVH
jgi:membrane associated rhomboid family serine protease